MDIIVSEMVKKVKSDTIDPERSTANEVNSAGLRILARIIARELLARRSAHRTQNDAKANETKQ